MDGRLWGIGRVILLAAMVGTGACGEDTPPGGSRDTGVSRDTGTGDASTEDAGDSDATVEDTGVVEACIPGDPSMEIESVRTAAAGAQTPSLAVCGAWVTYVRPAIGADPAGFFLQSNPSGPAIFVAVDPASLAPTPVVGDRVGLRATETVVQDGQVRITAVTNFERISTDNDTASLVQDLSAATDVVTNLNDYDSELITVTGTLTGAFIGAGEGHQRIQLSTAGLSDDENLRFRVVTSLIADLGLLSGCVVTVGPTPLWRFNDVAQPSAWRAEDVQVQRCANGPEVVGARATSASTVEITFSRPIAAASVLSELFSFDPFLNIVSVAVDGSVVTIETEPMVPLASYTVTVDTAVTDDLGAGVDPNGNTATFVAPGDAPAPNAPGSVVITEIMQNPALLNDTVGEYIEVYNTSTVTVDLNGCVLADAENDSHTITMPVTIAPGGYATLARSANPGFVPSYVFSDFLLGNGADEVVLRCGDELIDSVEYDGGPMFPDPTGASMNLNPDLLTAEDNDLGANWCESTSVFNGDRGTPNAANDSCAMMDAGVPMDAGMEADASTGPDASADAGFVPDGGVDPDAGMMPDAGGAPDGGITADAGGAPDGGIMADAGGAPDGGVANDAGVMPVPGEGDLVITEIMQNPSTLEDSMGEWFEIYNPTATTYELSGCSIADDGSDTHAILGSLMIFPGAYLTFSNGSMPGFTPDYIYTGVFLANGADEVILRCGSVIVDRVAYDGGPEFPDPTGASMNLDPALLDAIMNDMGSSWCEGVTDYNGDRGT
ncbi:MAG: lamin tail domain-containing protein, partial [Myxococcota bacterium]